MKWTSKERELLVEYAIASDAETIALCVDDAIHQLYREGSHPEFKERSHSSCTSMLYKEIKKIKERRYKELNGHLANP